MTYERGPNAVPETTVHDLRAGSSKLGLRGPGKWLLWQE